MAVQPIHGEDGTVVDQYDDGELGEEQDGQSSAPREEVTGEHQEEPSQVPPPEAIPEEHAEGTPHAWTVPEMLQGSKDLFIGMTVHHDDGNEHGPLVSLFVREVPDGEVTVRTYRADALSQQAFLDNLQIAIAVTIQAHFLAWAQRQRKKLEEEKRRSRQPQSPAKPSTAVGTTVAPTTAAPTQAPAAAQKPTTTASPATAAGKKPEKYVKVSMFD